MAYLARSLTGRSVHCRITPRPSNLGESREILRLLSQFGEIEYYKSLKYDGQGLGRANPGIGLVIYKEEEGARKCFKGSPVRFRMGKVKIGAQEAQQQREEQVQQERRDSRDDVGTGGKWGLPPKAPFGLEPEPQHQRRYSSTSTLPNPPERPLRMPFDPPSPRDTRAEKLADEERIFQIITSPTRRNFRLQADIGQWHGAYPLDKQSIGQEDLAKRVPLQGLSCVEWHGREKPLGVVTREKRVKEGRESLGALWERGQKIGAGGVDALGRVGVVRAR